MARNLSEVKAPEKARRGSQQTFEDQDLAEIALFADTYRDVLSQRSTESAKYFLGHGQRSRDDPNAGYMYADLQTSGASPIGGRMRFVVYADSEREVPIVGDQFALRDMREAAADARTERPVLPLQLPGAGKDKEIAIQVQASPDSDGDTVSAAESDVLIPYTQILQ